MENIKIKNISIPLCAVGTWGWGKGYNGGKTVFGSVPTIKELSECYNILKDNGLFIFDTAAVYGMGASEKILGDFSENDDKIIISSKFTPNKFQSASAMEKSLNKSLKRLKRNYIDIYWLHNSINLERNLKTAIKLLKNGKIKNIGLSNCTLDEIKYAQKVLSDNGYHLFGVQNHYSLLHRYSEQTGIIKWCKENNTKFFAYMVLEQGVLAGKTEFSRFSRRGKSYDKNKIKKVYPLIQILKATGKKYNISVAQTVIAHAVSKNIIPIIGARKPSQAKELIKVTGIKLTDNEISEIEKIAKSIKIEVGASWEKKMK